MKNQREKVVIRTSIISICSNLLLVGFKATKFLPSQLFQHHQFLHGKHSVT